MNSADNASVGGLSSAFLWKSLRYFHHILLHLLRGTVSFNPVISTIVFGYGNERNPG